MHERFKFVGNGNADMVTHMLGVADGMDWVMSY